MLGVTCRGSVIMCHMSFGLCHVSRVVCHMFCVTNVTSHSRGPSPWLITPPLFTVVCFPQTKIKIAPPSNLRTFLSKNRLFCAHYTFLTCSLEKFCNWSFWPRTFENGGNRFFCYAQSCPFRVYGISLFYGIELMCFQQCLKCWFPKKLLTKNK